MPATTDDQTPAEVEPGEQPASGRARRRASAARVREGLDLARRRWQVVVAVLVGHLALGILGDVVSSAVITVHAYLTLAVVAFLVLTSTRAGFFVASAGYITSSEVLWRMHDVPVPWEVAKYVTVGVFAAGLFRLIGPRARHVGLPGMYLLVLVPSVLFTVERLGPASFELLSFNIVAHVALVLGVVFCSNLTTDRASLTTVLWWLLAPVLAVNAVATRATLALDPADFSASGSNAAVTGGYGPNQVSALAGLALLACIFLGIFDRRRHLKVAAVVLGVWFAVQGALTFSRGGLFNVGVALLLAVPFFLSRARYAVRLVAMTVLVVFVGRVVDERHRDDEHDEDDQHRHGHEANGVASPA
ncbi:MAG: hypothetical protein AAGK32_07155, partial [Actinomycetota bacterium]